MKKLFSLFTAALIGAVSISAIAQDNPCGVEGVVVEASSFQYAPASVAIEVGQTVVWVNMGGTHDVNAAMSSIGEMWDNPETFTIPAVQGSSEGVCIGSHTFTVEGTYDYDCSIGNHAANGMVASVTVNPATQSNSVVDIIVNSEVHTVLEDAVVAAGLVDALSGEGPFTVFAPTDDAFTVLLAALGFTAEELLAYPGLTDVLLYHVVGAQALSTDLSDGQEITTLLDEDVLVTITADGVFINQAQVIVADLEADNGVVHVIDAVLVPEMEELPETVVDIIVESEVHTLLELAVGAAGLVDALSGEGPFTVFAPTDDAVVALTEALGITADDLLALPNLGEILQYHVVAGEAFSDDLEDGQMITTLLGQDVTVSIDDAGVMINEAMVIIADLEAENGVVHVIDAVLVPTATNVLETTMIDFNVYPNPTNTGVLNVQGGWDANATVQIWNAAGQLVRSEQVTQNQHLVSTDGLSGGLYTIRVLSGTSSGQKMFLVD
ncbi:MAG: fasciclin domain-containing protein [Flavobacteriales bacterium]|nr:fasciclin domain-containing protein [Flavobacteriales bacterium]